MSRLIRQFVLAVAAVAGAGAHDPLLAQEPVNQVIRFGDGRGVIVRYTEELADSMQPVPVKGFRLFDLERGTLVPTNQVSTMDRARCSYPTDFPRDRICIELRTDAPALRADARYALRTDSVQLRSGKYAEPDLLELDPVSGSVDKITAEGTWVVAHYNVDLGNDRSVDPRIHVNGREVPIVTDRVGGMPLCYRRGDYAFACQLASRYFQGDKIDLDLVTRTPPLRVVDSASIRPASVVLTAPKKREEAALYANVAYARLSGEEKGSFTLGVQNLAVWRRGQTSDRVRLMIGPFADVLLTTEDGKGRLTAGPQARLLLHRMLGLAMTDLRLTPRWETDDKGRLGELIYADVEAQLYLPYLSTGGLPGTGSRSLVPRLGFERGTTIHGADSLRVEADQMTRLKWGANGVISWPEDALSFAPAGLRLEGDLVVRSIDLRDAPANQVPRRPLYWSAQLAYGVSPNFAITLTRRSGRTPPLFRHQSAFEVGATFLR